MGKRKDRVPEVIPTVTKLRGIDGAWDTAPLITQTYDEFMDIVTRPVQEDVVNHPSHYTSDPSGVECITITRHRNFNIGSAFKYLWRNGLKDDPAQSGIDKQIEDLRKAVFFIEDEIQRLDMSRTVL